MDIYETKIENFKSASKPNSEWVAKGILFTIEGKVETEVFYAETKETAEDLAQNAIDRIINQVNLKKEEEIN